MKHAAVNPYLPLWEYVPDGEPHVFDGRVYVYGSHDRFNGYNFCLNDYVGWSAPIEDLSDWRYEGILYRRTQDPRNADGSQCLYAPDVAQGPDGRYYLYYALNGTSVISVAVCDTPAGEYVYYGDVAYPDGTLLGERPGDEHQFDPGVLADKDGAWLYSGFCPPMMPGRTGARAVRLAADMRTVISDPVTVVPGAQTAKGTGFEGHAFFEASSIRVVNGRYYFIYSSELSHELCYAVADHPLGPFTYGGTIISNADLGLSDKVRYFTGNNHGSIEQINGEWYVFYHRQTNSTNYSRQGCMEPITILSDGSIPQVEITSCGPNGGPLPAGEYPAAIACNLYLTKPPVINADAGQNPFPHITQDAPDITEPVDARDTSYIATLTPGVVVGYKYFDCCGIRALAVRTRGMCYGAKLEILLAPDADPIGSVPVVASNEWKWNRADIAIPDGVQALYLRATGFGIFSLAAIRLETDDYSCQ